MAKRSRIPQYGTVEINGLQYYKTYVLDSEEEATAHKHCYGSSHKVEYKIIFVEEAV